MKIYALRHGATEYNSLKKINGQTVNEPLSEKGFLDAEEAAKDIQKTISKIYSSSLIRAIQTAEIVNKNLNVEIVKCDELIDVNFGDLTGKTWEEAKAQYGEEIRTSFFAQNFDYSMYGGESSAQVFERLKKLIERIKKENHSENEVLLVTHGGIIRALNAIFYEREIPGAHNLSLHEFEI